MNPKIYPNRKWMMYWGAKKYRAKRDGIDFTLTTEDKLQLTESFPVKGEHPSISGYHLGRLDHDKGYSLDNVEWQWYSDNCREALSRRDYSYCTGENNVGWQGGKTTYLWKKRNETSNSEKMEQEIKESIQ